MKSILGAALAIGVVIAFGAAWALAKRETATLLDQQWLFLVALPYNLSVVQLFGDSDFSADAPGLVATAAAAEAAVAYLAGASMEAATRALWRCLRRLTARA